MSLSAHAESLHERSLSRLSGDEAQLVACEVDASLADPTISRADRGTLLVARAIAGQLFEPPQACLDRMLEALPHLEEALEHERQVAALTSAASFSLQIGNISECMELAVRALTLMGSAEVQNLAPSVPANLSVLFNEFSAFDLAYELSVEALEAHGGSSPEALGILVPYGLARTIMDAAWLADEGARDLDRLTIAEDAARAVCAGVGEVETSRTLVTSLILSEVALLRGKLEMASVHIEAALTLPDGAQKTFEGYAKLVAAMVARRQNQPRRALDLLDAAEPSVAVTVHRLDRLRSERAAALAELGDFEAAHIEATLRAETASRYRFRYMGAVIEQIRARAKAERSRQSLAATAESLEERTKRDPLTGVASRGWFDACVEERKSAGGEAAIIMFDLDHFKQINDTYSHQAGDVVLRRFGELLRENCSEDDIAARYGGEEFVVLPATGKLESVRELAEMVRMAVEAEDWSSHIDGLDVTVSAGFSVGASTRILEILRAADAALYKSKHLGRNRVDGSVLRTRATDR